VNAFSSASCVLPIAQKPKDLERAQETQRIITILHQWGIHTLGQLATLPRDELAARLGACALELWERANGQSERMLKLVAPPESFIESFEFENEIETVEPLLFMLRRFLQQLALRLNAIYLVAKELRLQITFADKSHYDCVFKIPEPTNKEEILFRMLHTHLENFTSAHPISAVELEAQPSRPARQQFGFFETALRDPLQLHETLARLVGLLGVDRVGTPVLEETHQPDAFRMEPFAWEFGNPERSREPVLNEAKSSRRKMSMPVTPSVVEGSRDVTLKLTRRDSHSNRLRLAQGRLSTSLRSARNDRDALIPLRRFRKRTAATVLLDENKPVHLRAPGLEGAMTTQAGPYPLSGNWWDERAWARVEWDVEVENGAVLRCHFDDHGRWEVDGFYD
jgi:nucleotidyltransferase/DNA polymerase involved in DNA repair